jgi:hypothetical protein
MNYLAGPITRMRIGELNTLAGSSGELADTRQAVSAQSGMRDVAQAKREPAQAKIEIGTATRPQIPARIAEYFLPVEHSLADAARAARQEWAADADYLGVLYHPSLIAQADIRINQRSYGVDTSMLRTAIVIEPDERGYVRWEEHLLERAVEERNLVRSPERDARFGDLNAPFSDSRTLTTIKNDFVDWVYRETAVTVYANETLKLYGIDKAVVAREAEDAADEAMQDDVKKVDSTFEKKVAALQTKLQREERELAEDEAELSARKREEGVKHLETIAGLFGFGRKRSVSTSMSKRRMTSKAAADVDESKDEIERLTREIEAMRDEHEDALEEVRQKWLAISAELSEITVNPYKKDVRVELFGVAWLPHHVVDDNGRTVELPAFSVAT